MASVLNLWLIGVRVSERRPLTGAYVHTVRTCRDAVELLADVLGTASVFRTCPVERHRRDLATIAQHITAQPRFLEIVGGLWIDGADLDHPLLNAPPVLSSRRPRHPTGTANRNRARAGRAR